MRLFKSPRIRTLAALLSLAVALAGCERGPIHPHLALPAVGELVPRFDFPLLGKAGSVSSDSLRGVLTVLALWSTHCPTSRKAVETINSLYDEFASRGVRVVVLASDRDNAELEQVVREYRMRAPVAVAGRKLQPLFDRSDTAPERDSVRVQYVEPSYLVLDHYGRIASRNFGTSTAALSLVLDSLLATNSR